MIRRHALVERLEPRQLLSASMVKDLNTTPASLPGLWTWVGAGDTVFLSQEDGVAGWELYKTDGTTGGTVLVKDIRPGRDNSSPGWMTYAGNGTIFFTADDGSHGVELWKSDGTTGGTVMVKDITPGATGSGAGGLVNVNGTIYFSASDGVNGFELWKSDGSEAGTVMVKDIATGSSGFPSTPNSSSPSQLINNNGVLFFRATTSASGAELWKSDGSDAGTTQVAELFNNNNNGMANTPMTAVGGFVYFAGITSTGGTDVWRSDGSNTTRVKDLASGATPANFKSSGGRAYYTVSAAGADFGLWSTDGTTPTSVFAATTQGWTDVNGALFFGSGGTLYSTTGGAPAVLKSGLSMATNTGPWTNAGGTLFFTANDNSGAGEELWKSNGTPAGTVMVKDVEPGPTSSNPIGMTPYGPGGTSIIFGTFAGAATGGAIFRSDGSDPGTVLVKDINPATADASPLIITPFKNWVYFIASEPTYSNGTIGELYRSDGTEAGTGIAVDLVPGPAGSTTTPVKVMGDWFYFAGNDGSGIGKELWRTDGTTTQFVKDINPGSGSSGPSPAVSNVVSGNFLYFAATSAAQGEELWRTDGTGTGTIRLTDIFSGTGSSQVSLLTDVAGTLYFTAFSSSSTFAGLWKTDGFTTTQVANNTVFSSIASMLNVNGTLYVSGTTSANGAELYKIAPGGSTPVLVRDINTTGNSSPGNLTNVDGTLFFSAGDGTSNGTELWKSDGSTAGTVMVKNIRPGAFESSSPTQMVGANGVAYFRADDGVNGAELWRSDGTAAGTYMLKDITPTGATNGLPQRLFVANGFVYFAANDYNNITPDAWRSDGTPEGTAPISRFPRGAFLSFPSNASFFAAMGGDVYYNFTDDTHGGELWKSDQPDFATMGAGGVLTVSGTGGNDAIGVSSDGSGLHVTLNGLTENFAPGAVASVVIAGKVGVDTVNVTGGAVTFGGGDSGANSANLTIHVGAGASANFTGTQNLAALVLEGGGNATVAPGGGKTLVVGNVSISGGGSLNLNDNAMVVRGGASAAAIGDLIRPSFNNGNWNGAGGAITSGSAAADASRLTALGYGSNADLHKSSFAGVTNLTPDDVLVKYTYYGDSDLSGVTTLDDFTLFLNGYQNAGTDWFRGDYDYSGVVTLDDFTLFLRGYQGQGAPL